MTKRVISFILVVIMLFALCISTASCAQLEEFVGYENLGDEYMDKYHPEWNDGTADGGSDHTHNFVEGKCECGESDPNYTPGGDVQDPNVIPNEHASYAEKKDGEK